MIDTDKYEGHTPMWYLEGTIGVWRIESDFTTHDAPEIAILWTRNEADAQLLADAPDLLIEVKRLKKIIGKFDDFMCNNWTPANVHSLWNELLTKRTHPFHEREDDEE